MDDVTAIKDLFDRHRAAWDRGDGEAHAASWTPDGSYVTWLGSPYQGREDIARSHQALFDSFLRGMRMALEKLDIRFYGPDTAVVTTRGDVGKKPKRAALREAISFKLQPATKPAR